MSIVRVDSLGSPEQLRQELLRLVDSGAAQAVLRDALVPEALDQVAGRSYAHANGFDKLVVAACPEGGWKLRLHIWPETSVERLVENVHNHRWDFASVGLEGELEAEYYSVEEAKEGGLDAFDYYSPDAGDSYRFEHVGRAVARLASIASLRTDASYSMGHEEFHRVSLATGPAMTLVLQGPVRKRSTRVLRTQGSTPVITTVTRMAARRAQELVSRALPLLAAA